VDKERIEKRIAEIEEFLEAAEKVASLDPGEFLSDFRNWYSLRMAIVSIVESATSISLELLGRECINAGSYSAVFILMAKRGLLPVDVGEGMARLASLRNLIIHRYWEVDDLRIRKEALEGGFDLIKRFVNAVRGAIEGGH